MEQLRIFIINELRDIKALLQDGLRSGAYLYPFRVFPTSPTFSTAGI